MNELDTLRWFFQRRSRTPNFGGAHPGGYDPKFEFSGDFCTIPTPSFTILCLLVWKLSYKQTNRRCWNRSAPFPIRYDVG